MSRWLVPLTAACVGVFTNGCSKGEAPAMPGLHRPIDYPAAYVVLSGDHAIAVIDADTDVLAGVVQLAPGTWPHHLNISPDGSKIAVAMPGMDLSGGHGGGHGRGQGSVGPMSDASGGGMGHIALLGARLADSLRMRDLEQMVHNAAFSPDGTEIWTAMMADSASGMNVVRVYDGSLDSLLAEIPVGSLPQEISFSADGNHAFVCNNESGTVSMIHVPSHGVVATIPVGEGPVGAWPGVDGLMYVDNEGSQSLSVIDPGSQSVVATLELGFVPGYAATPPSLPEVWVTDPAGGRVHRYDRTTRLHLGEIVTGTGAHAIAFNAGGTKAYVTNTDAGSVSVVSVATLAVAKTIAVGVKPNGIALRTP